MRLACSAVLSSLVLGAVVGAAPDSREGRPPVVASPSPASGAAARVIEIAVGDNMRFVPSAVSASPGELVKVVLRDTGQLPKLAMAHNFVLLKPGVDPKAFVDKSAAARETAFIAPAVQDEVLAHTGLVGPGETSEVTFAAPARPGVYTFLCSFPGHFALGMKGVLTVK
jgi:azurin